MPSRARSLGSLGATTQGAAAGASTGAAIGSAVPVIGTAVGAVVGAVVGGLFSKKKDPNAAEKAALKGQLDDYVKVMGQIPGRAFSLLQLKQLADGAGQKGMWPAVKKWSGDAIAGVIDGCKGCTPPTLPVWVQQQVQAGNTDPRQLADLWTQHVNQTWGSKWFVATAGPVQRQIITDLIDYYVGLYAPQAPLTYAPSWTAGAQVAAPTSTPAPIVTPAPSTPAPLPAVVRPRPTQTATATPSIPPAAADNTKALIDALLAQGATGQQAFASALQSLNAQGVQTSNPQVQQAVAQEVQSSASQGVTLSWPMVAAGVGVVGVVGVLVYSIARRRSGGKAR